jgi:metalloendopeptidase OMA1, mitochondrial
MSRSRSFPVWLLMVGTLCGCATVPYTNRTQLMMVSQANEMKLGAAAYQQVLQKERITNDPRLTEPVLRVGQRIAAAADQEEYHWQFTVIDDPKQANAFCLPGGKVAVYTGIFPIARDDAGLATVIGHEVAHALARHGAERMSQSELLQLGAVGVGVAAGGASPGVQQAVMEAYGLGSTVGVALPFGRSQESEADHIGLILMAKAGYNPEAAIGLWERMQASERGHPPEWLSTHPASATRIEDIRRWLPEAQQYFVPPGVQVAALPSIPGALARNE